jgi:hypothetical protein
MLERTFISRAAAHFFLRKVSPMTNRLRAGTSAIVSGILFACSGGPSVALAATARPVNDFLNSIGINTTMPDRGQPIDKTIEMIKFGGWRWARGGIEGVTETGPTTIQTFIDLHKATGLKFDWGLVSGGNDLPRLIKLAHTMAANDALLAFEGNNEPNNWGVTYKGEEGGGHDGKSWMAVAHIQHDLYETVKSDPQLAKYPVWSISENGAEVDDVGLQFLKIPEGANCLMPAGTTYADAANVHNYIYHNNAPNVEDNKTWNDADPGPACKVDGLRGNYGVTWGKGFKGYTDEQLKTLPRVTTETGCTIDGNVTEDIQADNLTTMYLDQFKRGWSYTCPYLLRDRTDESGNQSFGFFKVDYTPRKAATYLHNLTTVLADAGSDLVKHRPETHFNYAIANPPATLHDLLLEKSDGTFEVIVWNERVKGSNDVTITFDQPTTFKQYDIAAGVTPTDTQTAAKSVTLKMNDHVMVLEIAAK